MIYLDNSATTQPCEACVRAMTELLTDCWGNPSSVHAHGIAAHHRLRQAREQFEKAYLDYQLEKHTGNVSKMAKEAGMERTHLYRKLRSLGIEIKERR